MFKNKLCLTYDNEYLQDGTFAQIQRNLAIFSIASRLKFKFQNSGIKDIAISHVDEYLTVEEKKNYLNFWNKLFIFPNYDLDQNFRIIYIPILTIRRLIFEWFISFFHRETRLLKVGNPYPVIEKFPNYYDELKRLKFSTKIYRNSENFKNLVVLHIRRGINTLHVIPGETVVRVLPDKYYLKVLSEVPSINKKNICIISDAPSSHFLYTPIGTERQNKHWLNEYASYVRENGQILIEGHSFEQFRKIYGKKLSINRGGSLFEAFLKAVNSESFIMSRSSFSFVCGLLNQRGTVFYPPNFWHKPLPHWKKCQL